MNSPLLSVQDAAKMLNISARALHRLIREGVIPAVATSRGYFLLRPEDIAGLEVEYTDILAAVNRKKRQKAQQSNAAAETNGQEAFSHGTATTNS